jgi:alpha-tubulin suppressor-like RCC1 family protein
MYFSNDLDIVQISAGYQFALALDSGGNIYAWGYNVFFYFKLKAGQLGLYIIKYIGLFDNIQRNSPTQVTLIKNIIQVSSGEIHSLALNQSGYVYATGDNDVKFF